MQKPVINIADIKEFGNLELLAKQMVEGFITGLHKSPYHGFSVEFAEHRTYNTGESTRHLDWKIFAKTDKLFTKRYEEETNLRAMMLLDVSSSMYYPLPNYNKIKFSVLASACLAYLLTKQRDAVGVTAFSDQIEWQTDVKSTQTHLRTILSRLNALLDTKPENKATKLADTLHIIAEKIHKRSLVVIFSDMFNSREDEDELFNALQHLKHKKHEVLLFHVTDHATELNFDFENIPYEFIDVETGHKVKVNPYEIREQYKAKMVEYSKKLTLRCAQFKIDLIETDCAAGVDTVLSTYLTKRTKMH